MTRNETNPEVTALLDKVTKGLNEACKHYVFEPINQVTLHRLKHSINEVFNRCLPERTPVGEYLTVVMDPDNRNNVVMKPKPNSPDWVHDLFRVMRGELYAVDFTITKDGEINDLTSGWKRI